MGDVSLGHDEPTSLRANFGKSSENPYKGGLAPVGGREARSSPYGAQDLAGNVAEWVADWFAEGFLRGDVQKSEGAGDRQSEGDSRRRMVRPSG